LYKILLILKNNNRFDLKGKIKNYYHFFFIIVIVITRFKKTIITITEENIIFLKKIEKYKNLSREVKYYY